MKINKDIKTFYINLNDNLDRKKNIENLLKKYKFSNYQRFEAVNTKTYLNLLKNIQKYEKIFNKKIMTQDTLNDLENKIKRKSDSELSLGAVGCYLSHISIYKKIIDQNIPYALILEDDVDIEINSNIFWNKINNINIPEDTDIFLFDYVLFDYDKTEIEYIYKINFFYCLHFYLITLNGAKKCLEYLLPIKIQIDGLLSRLSYLNLINIYGYNNNDLKIYQRSNYSNIQIKCDECNINKEILEFKKSNIDIIKLHGNLIENNKILTEKFFKYEKIFLLILLVILIFLFNRKYKLLNF